MTDGMKEEIRDRMGGGGFVGFPAAAEGLSESDSVQHTQGCSILPQAEASVIDMWDRTGSTGAEVLAPVIVRDGRVTVGAKRSGEPDSIDTSNVFDSVPTDLADKMGLIHTHPAGGWNSVMSHTDIYSHTVKSRDRHPKYAMGFVVTEVGGDVVMFGLENNTNTERQTFDRAMVEMEGGLTTADQAFISNDLEQAKEGISSMWEVASALVMPCRQKVKQP